MIRRRETKEKKRERAMCKEAVVPLVHEGTKRATHGRASENYQRSHPLGTVAIVSLCQ